MNPKYLLSAEENYSLLLVGICRITLKIVEVIKVMHLDKRGDEVGFFEYLVSRKNGGGSKLSNDQTCNENELQRGIHPWMANLIALGGIIGSCYFIGSGWLIQALGVSAAFAFIMGGVIIYVVMQCFAELLVNIPRRGSFVSYSREFIHPIWAVGTGWSYWFNWVAYIPSEAVAGGIIMTTLFKHVAVIGAVPGFAWAVIFLILITFINLSHVESFGMIESVLALLKIGAVAVFSIVALGLIFGVFGGHAVGTSILFPSGHASLSQLFPAGWFPLFSYLALILVNFQGSEIIGLAAAETRNPETTVPKACRQVTWRIIGVYVIPITLLVLILSRNDSGLNGSMFAEALGKYSLLLHIPWLGWIAACFALVVLSAAFSCANSGMFGTVRSLYALGVEGLAPKAFTKLNKNGVPHNATVFTLCCCWVVLAINVFFGQTDFYAVLISISGFTGTICWISICLSQVMFRRRIIQRGYTKKDLKAPAPLSPFVPLVIGVGLESVGLILMLFSGDNVLILACIASIIVLIVPMVVFAIAAKMGKVKVELLLHSEEREFDVLWPDKRLKNNESVV